MFFYTVAHCCTCDITGDCLDHPIATVLFMMSHIPLTDVTMELLTDSFISRSNPLTAHFHSSIGNTQTSLVSSFRCYKHVLQVLPLVL